MATEDERLYESEFALYIACAWRLDEGHEVVGSSGDAYPHYGRMADGWRRLIGASLVGGDIRRPGLDLTLTFDKGRQCTSSATNQRAKTTTIGARQRPHTASRRTEG